MKHHYIVSDDAGRILRWGSTDDPDELVLQGGVGKVVHWHDGSRIDTRSQRVEVVIDDYGDRHARLVDVVPDRPADDEWREWRLDASGRRWVAHPTLAALRRDKASAITAEAERRGHLPIEFAGAMFDADERGQRNILFWQGQLANGAPLPQGFVWRDADNVDHPADAAFVNGLGLAVAMRGTALYQTAWALKSQLVAAATEAEIDAIDWPT